MFVGADDDTPKWAGPQASVAVARDLGLKAIRITVPWRPGESQLSRSTRVELDRAVVGSWGLRAVLAVYGRPQDAPRDERSRAQYCDYVVDLIKTYPTVNDIVIWNEPNAESFWKPQFNPDGTSAAPAAYGELLARCWSALHARRPKVNMIAASAPRGSDNPSAVTGVSHSPGRWYRLLGAAYRASGRQLPIFDTVGHNPYPDNSAERPWARHSSSGSIGQGDYDTLMEILEEAFGGTGQGVPGELGVSVWYMEQGFQTTVDPAKAHLYTGAETEASTLPARSSRYDDRRSPAPDQETQLVDALRLAYCQPHVGAFFNFELADEPDLAGWQSGLLWTDWSPKPSYTMFKRVVAEVNAGKVDCSDLLPPSAPPAGGPKTELGISDVSLASVTPFSATLGFRTTLPSGGWVAYGPADAEPTLWSPVEGSAFEHRAKLSGLSHGTAYRVSITAVAPDGHRATTQLDFATPGPPRSPVTSVDRAAGAVLLDGEPFFPFMVLGQCPYEYETSLAIGINLFVDNFCGSVQEQLDSLGGRALAATLAGKPGGTGPGLVGFFWPDEADGLGITGPSLPPPPTGVPQVSFLTLTNHFYSGADPLPMGRDMYPGLIARSDIVGFDLYPLQEWCQPSRMADVYLAQKELVRLTGGKPTFQWIEAAQWRCGGAAAVTPATVRAESWLAIAGGAHGLGFFPWSWKPDIAQAIAEVSRDIDRLAPALLAPSKWVRVDPSASPVKVGVRAYHGALYVIAVNSAYKPARATIRVTDLDGRPLRVLGEKRTVPSLGGIFSDRFEPLAVHVYVAAPRGAG